MKIYKIKGLVIVLSLLVLASFTPIKTALLEWTWIYDTTWQQKSDETNNTNVWVPTFNKKLKALDNTDVLVSGYISVDSKGNYILTQFKRNPKSDKDRTAEAPDYILLSDWDVSTYYAALKKYTMQGRLVLSEYADADAAISLHEATIATK